jgi:dihydroxyacetone kinase
MKLRFEDNSLRLRLSAAEVAQFAETGRVAVVVPLGLTPHESLTYALERSASEEFRITHGAGAITVKVPATLANHWTSTDQNGLSATLMMAKDQPLKVLVEKDLDCRH